MTRIEGQITHKSGDLPFCSRLDILKPSFNCLSAFGVRPVVSWGPYSMGAGDGNRIDYFYLYRQFLSAVSGLAAWAGRRAAEHIDSDASSQRRSQLRRG